MKSADENREEVTEVKRAQFYLQGCMSWRNFKFYIINTQGGKNVPSNRGNVNHYKTGKCKR